MEKQPVENRKSAKTASQVTRKIALLAVLAALSIVGRIFMASIPNVQPCTVIIICSSFVFGIRFGLALAFLTVFGSDMFLGMGFFAIMQFIAWGSVAVLSGLLGKKQFYKKVPHIVLCLYAGFTGILFGFMVSLNYLFIGGPYAFWTYYLAGLLFDGYHAAGNFVIYLILGPILIKLIAKEKERIYGV
ncbi:membrane protein [Weizmannia acidilactici]|uniref:Membrane protein n=1 Tax=Weizmannia acidilactici TaxID=2607726 RepID=A0A5J4JIF2_9BACI|nr:ECF transporter S component [Weizmannia acidilactici]GER71501.1 membrane protein [Weizmannia acidilactici]